MKNEKKMTEQNSLERILDLKVIRELLDAKTKDGGDMYCYILREKTVINGIEREIRCDFVAKDLGGYEMLDIIFMTGDEAYLSVREESMTDEKTGETTLYSVYEVWNKDDDGIVYSYKVKPSKESDKAKLNVILQKRSLAYKKAKKELDEKTMEKVVKDS